MRGAETMAWSRDQQVARGYLGNAPPPRISFLRIVKKSDGRNMLQTHINTVDAITFPMVLAEPLRSKDRALLSYNIDDMSLELDSSKK